MNGNVHVRFGGSLSEKEQPCHLAGRLPYTEADRSLTTILLPHEY
jgi:hypothetical protein